MVELDSDVNEDANREQQLDQSFEQWYKQMDNQVQQAEEITSVTDQNVFEAAENMDMEDANPVDIE